MSPKRYVVVLEEDPLIRPLLERWLGEAGYKVAPMGAGRPALVVADVPDPESAEPHIRSMQQEYAAPILLLSARFRRGLAGSAEAARRLGVKKVLPKPFTRKELLAAVREKDVRFWRTLLWWEARLCEQPGVLDAGTHIIAVVRRA